MPDPAALSPLDLDAGLTLQEQNAHLRAALEHRDVIGQAKGILMERHGIDAEEAFERLRALSQDTNVKLHLVAAAIATAHDTEHLCSDS